MEGLGRNADRRGVEFRYWGSGRQFKPPKERFPPSDRQSGDNGNHQEAQNPCDPPGDRLPNATDHHQPVFEFIQNLDYQLHKYAPCCTKPDFRLSTVSPTCCDGYLSCSDVPSWATPAAGVTKSEFGSVVEGVLNPHFEELERVVRAHVPACRDPAGNGVAPKTGLFLDTVAKGCKTGMA
jgi:hypothetical protein